MAIRQIRLQGDEILQKQAKPVGKINNGITQLLDDMLETLRKMDGVGLAAPQVGSLRRVIVIEHEDLFYEIINPEVISTEGTQKSNEACLSVKGLCGDVSRPRRLCIRAQNRQGESITLEVEDFLATVLAHEMDHLDGKLFLDIATNITRISQEQLDERRRARKRGTAKK